MVGILRWSEKGEGGLAWVRCLSQPFLCLSLPRGERTPELIMGRRVLRAAKALRRERVEQVVAPPDFPYWRELEKGGVGAVSTAALRRALASDWVRQGLKERGCRAGAKVAVCAKELSGEVVRTVTELSLRERYVLLDTAYGGEELCRRLRREYGVSLLLTREQEQLEQAEGLVLFDRREGLTESNPVCLPLYRPDLPLPKIALSPAREQGMLSGVDRGQLLAALYASGTLRRGDMTVTGMDARE